MKIKKTELVKIIAEEANRLLRERREETQPHLAELQEIRRKLGVLEGDLIDKLGGDKFVQDAQMELINAKQALYGAMEAIRDSLEGQGLSEQAQEPDPRMVAVQDAFNMLDDLQWDSLESALDNMNTEVMRKLSIMMRELDYKRNQVGNLEEGENK